jgi:hypothetical protein
MFKLKIKAVGMVEALKIGKEDKDVNLQFLDKNEKGLNLVNVKVVGATKADLTGFVGKKVEIEDVVITKIEYNTFYKIEDISKISEIK